MSSSNGVNRASKRQSEKREGYVDHLDRKSLFKDSQDMKEAMEQLRAEQSSMRGRRQSTLTQDELDRSHTRHFYPVDEVMSALQKAVRRGLVEEAVFWARELNCSGLSRVLADRLLVLSVEDIGIASVESCRWTVMLRQCYLSHRDPTIGCTFLEAGIWALASHPCNRMSCVACLWQRSRVRCH